MSDLNNWLAVLSSLGVRDDFPGLLVGSNYALQWEIPAHPVLGDFTEGEFVMEIKAAPGLDEEVLATATVLSGTFAGGVNPVTITVPVSEHAALLGAGDGKAVNRVATILYVPPGADAEIVRGGLLPVGAGVTGLPA